MVKGRGTRRRFLAHTSFAAHGNLDPGLTGVALAIHAMDGEPLYEAAIPGAAFRASENRRAFRYVMRPRRPIDTANGLRRVSIRVDRNIAYVTAAGVSPALAAVAGQPALSWTLSVDGACIRDLELSCSADRAAVTSCQ